jgi:hypothetical protein
MLSAVFRSEHERWLKLTWPRRRTSNAMPPHKGREPVKALTRLPGFGSIGIFLLPEAVARPARGGEFRLPSRPKVFSGVHLS